MQSDPAFSRGRLLAAFPEPQPRLPCTYFLNLLTMMSAIIFGLDMGTFGIAHGLPSFLKHWCIGGGFTDPLLALPSESCAGQHAPQNQRWMHGFVLPSVVLNLAAAALSCVLIAPALLSRLGRRPPAVLGLCITAAGCFTHSFVAAHATPVKSVGVCLWFIGRFVLGIGIGLLFATMPAWNNELVTRSMRGKTGAVLQVTNILGVLIAGLVALAVKRNSSNHGISENTSLGWLIPTSLTGIFAVALLVPVSLIPESPVWVLQKYSKCSDSAQKLKLSQRALSILKTIRTWRGRSAEVRQYKDALSDVFHSISDHRAKGQSRRLEQQIWQALIQDANQRRSDDDVQTDVLRIEVATILWEIECTSPPTCVAFTRNTPRRLLQRTLIAIFVGGIGQNLAGMIALNNLSFQLFSEVGIDKPFVSTAIFDCVQLLGAIAGALYLDRGGRRHNLLVGSACLFCFILFVGVGLLRTKHGTIKSINDSNFVFLLLYAFAFHATWAAAWV